MPIDRWDCFSSTSWLSVTNSPYLSRRRSNPLRVVTYLQINSVDVLNLMMLIYNGHRKLENPSFWGRLWPLKRFSRIKWYKISHNPSDTLNPCNSSYSYLMRLQLGRHPVLSVWSLMTEAKKFSTFSLRLQINTDLTRIPVFVKGHCVYCLYNNDLSWEQDFPPSYIFRSLAPETPVLRHPGRGTRHQGLTLVEVKMGKTLEFFKLR